MKKVLFIGGMLSTFFYASAQQRLVLYEEFSGENCGPCAATNPGLWDTLTTSPNASKILLIKYQSPIPSAGPIYFQDSVDVKNRMIYYAVPFAPYGRMDGDVSPGGTGQSAGHPGYLTKAHIATETAIASPFNITVTNVVTGTNIASTINVTAASAYNGGSNVKLRAALVETLEYATPPGSNGETKFHHVVRKMYPTADGQAIPGTWTAGQTATYTFSGAIPTYVDRSSGELFVVVWIQNDADKKIAQAAKSTNLPPVAIDVKSSGITATGLTSGVLNCGVSNINPKVTIKNAGSTTLTSAKIFYRVGSGAWSSQQWSGTLAANASTDVTLTAIPGAAGSITLQDSVALPNNVTDENPINNNSSASYVVLANTNGQALPISTDFESNASNWIPYSATDGFPFMIYTLNGKGYNGSNKMLAYPCYNLPATFTAGYNIFPFANVPAGTKALEFYAAYAQYKNQQGQTEGNDKLEVVYSTNCGQSWTSVWTKAGADLATAAPTSQSYIPSGNSEWKLWSVDMTSVPNGAQIGLRVKSDYGNNIFVDNVNFRTGSVTGIEELVSGGNATLYPNPVADQLNVELNMVKTAKVSFNIVNVMGQQLGQPVVKTLTTGNNVTAISTSTLAPGVYFLNIATDNGNVQQKFVKK